MDWDHLYSAHFFNLTTLTFDVYRSTDVVTVMQHSEFSLLQEFQLVVPDLSWEEAEQLLNALSLCNACKSLQRIEIIVDDGDGDLPWTAVRHLLSFPQLRTMRFYCPIYLDNDLLWKLCHVGRTSAIWI
ncbi:hypothetical protein AZE42_09370 [Rhizopogon vesiculosus]|uniref:F-box domain-containing protein n=1 Tax=Rhizopogon vesiculosus TaxID=180088 RepID=A0A1J8PQU5_9AGAM|nr:hypothetical protein AZE42_09370 [Rhizopogon vesiculosus]